MNLQLCYYPGHLPSQLVCNHDYQPSPALPGANSAFADGIRGIASPFFQSSSVAEALMTLRFRYHDAMTLRYLQMQG